MVSESWNQLHSWIFEASEGISSSSSMINNPSLTFHPWQKITCADLNSDGVLQVNDVQLLTTLIQNQPVGRVKPRVGNQPQIQIPFTRSRTGEKTSVRSSVLNFFRRSSSTRN